MPDYFKKKYAKGWECFYKIECLFVLNVEGCQQLGDLYKNEKPNSTK